MRPPASPLLTALRARTRPTHERLDASPFTARLTAGTLDADGYRALIRWQRRAHAEVELGLADFPWPAEYAYASRAAALADERVADNRDPTDADAEEEETDTALQPPTDLATATGRAYVLEGSSLGGNLILGHLRANSSLAAFAPFPLYAHQRTDGMPQWRAFVTFAASRSWTADETAIACEAAAEAFAAFERHLPS